VASSESVKGFLKWERMITPKLVQLDKVLHEEFTAVCSEEKLVTGPMIIENLSIFIIKRKITDKCTFSEGWLQNLGIV
jgi:hypothetical protein